MTKEGGPSVLILSDDYVHIRNMLRDAGYAPAGLPDAESAREIFEAMSPTLVIADVELGSMTGRRTLPYFIHQLSRQPHTPILGIAAPGFTQEGKAPAERYDAICHRPVADRDLLAQVAVMAPTS